jgi:hypothetical protein
VGLFVQLLTLPLAPVRAAVWVAERIQEAAEEQYYDPTPVERALAELESALVSGEIDEATFDACEDTLLDRLEEINAWRRTGTGSR